MMAVIKGLLVKRMNSDYRTMIVALSAAALALGLGLGLNSAPSSAATTERALAPKSWRTEPAAKPQPDRSGLDLSGRKRFGKASFYAGRFVGQKMADGTIMNPRADNAASRTLPLGTVAKVTNLESGKSAVVTIRDRGPYVDGRIVDLTPATALKIGLALRQGVTRVVVAPIQIPLANGGVKFGAGARERSGTLVARNWR
jgi:rare lipoprotein A